jgi:hypothetical protein
MELDFPRHPVMATKSLARRHPSFALVMADFLTSADVVAL